MKRFKGLLTTLLLFFAAFAVFAIVSSRQKQIHTVDPYMVEDLKNRGIDIGDGDGCDSIEAIFGGDVLSQTNVGSGSHPDFGTSVGTGMGVPTSTVPSRIAECMGSTTPPSFLVAEHARPYTAQHDNVSAPVSDDIPVDELDIVPAEEQDIIPVDESDDECDDECDGEFDDISVEVEEQQHGPLKPLPRVEDTGFPDTFASFAGVEGTAEDADDDEELRNSVRFTSVTPVAPVESPLLFDAMPFSVAPEPEPPIPHLLSVTTPHARPVSSIATVVSLTDTENRMDPVTWYHVPAPVPGPLFAEPLFTEPTFPAPWPDPITLAAVPVSAEPVVTVRGGVRDTALMFDDQILAGTDHTPIRVSVVNLANQYRENVQSGNVLDGFLQLTQLYTHPQLRPQERRMMLPPLDQLAGKVMYDRTVHLLEPPYVVQSGDTVESIAATYRVTPQLLININRLDSRRPLRANDTLKVLRGPFHLVVDPSNHEIQVFLSGYYAGRFRYGSSPFSFSEAGTYPIRQKRLLTAAAGTSSTHSVTANSNNNSPVRDQSHVFGWFTFGDKGMVIATANPKLIGTNQLSQEGYCMTEGDMRDVFCLLTADSTLTFPP